MNLPLPALDSEDYKLTKCMVQMWTDFAKTGYCNLIIFFKFCNSPREREKEREREREREEGIHQDN